jgi:hypothetical protein
VVLLEAVASGFNAGVILRCRLLGPMRNYESVRAALYRAADVPPGEDWRNRFHVKWPRTHMRRRVRKTAAALYCDATVVELDSVLIPVSKLEDLRAMTGRLRRTRPLWCRA